MIKKFVSKALLSVFMDKQAREKLDAGKNPKVAHPSATDEQAGEGEPHQPADPMDEMGQDEIASLIRDSLDEAERELVERKTKKAANPERQALIDQAMSIHRSKQYIVDELPKEQREKLMYMALQTLGPKPPRGDGDR